MEYFVYAVVILMALRCISFGIFSIKHQNISGGIACLALSVLSAVFGFAVFY